ncbi:MAG: arginine--tRNA ligase [Armatimonadetes bacterium]|nr:arginine--tRNA ligase [Armatimonadota bacterium]
MDYALLEAKAQIRRQLEAFGPELNDLALEHPPKGINADLAMPVFPMAKAWRKGPPVIAKEIAEKLDWPEEGLIERAEAAGGYVNFHFKRERFGERVVSDVATHGLDYGQLDRGRDHTVVLDYSAPNIAKPMSVGHLRSTIIGEALARIFRKLGYATVGINYLGDWGTQFGRLTYAFIQWGDEAALEADPIQELLRVYVKFHDLMEEDESLEEQGRVWFAKLERGEEEALALWRRFRDLSIREFEKIYRRLGVQFDVWSGESEFYSAMSDRVIQEAQEKGITANDQGALIIPLEEYGLSAPILLRKSNETTSYETRDLAAALYRLDTYHPAKVLYAVGNEQSFRFQQIFKALELMGYGGVEWVHVNFGFMTLPSGRMSTRKGNVVLLEDVLDEAIERAGRVIEEKNPDLTPEERAEVARVVGIGAIKYSDLSQSRGKDVVFEWDRMLAFDGESAPYLQYTYVRCRSIHRRANVALQPFDGAALEAPEEHELLKTLARFPEIIEDAAREYAPHTIANYLFSLAQEFQGFYEKVPVLKAGSEAQVSNRLQIVDSVATVIRSGLDLLGIEVPERM